MLNIIKEQSQDHLTIALEGRVDVSTAPDLEQVVTGSLDGVTELVFDLEKLVYISSSGLRVLLMARKKMNRQGSMKVIHVNEMVMEVFVAMGFADIMTIEQRQSVCRTVSYGAGHRSEQSVHAILAGQYSSPRWPMPRASSSNRLCMTRCAHPR